MVNEVKKFVDEEEWVGASVEFISEFLKSGALIGLAGGNTPRPVYEQLGQRDLTGVRFVTIDERYVPRSDDYSNFKMISDAMPEADLIGFDTSLSIDEAAIDMQHKLQEFEKGFDLLVLGMGVDGHVASLFPGSEALDSQDLAVSTDERLTLTYPVLLEADKAVLLISGNEKVQVLENVMDGGEGYPISRVLEEIETEVFVY